MHGHVRRPSSSATAGLRCAAVAALVALVVLMTLAAPASPARATDTAEDGVVRIAVTGMTPTAVTTQDEVRVTVQVTNATAEPLEDASVGLSIVRYRLASIQILTNWYLGHETIIQPAELARVAIEEPIPAGGTRTVTVSVPGDGLGLLDYPEASGPRGIVLDVTDSGHRTLADAKSFLLWYPTGSVSTPTRVSVLVPVTGPAPTPAAPESWGVGLGVDTSSDGRLTHLLEATSDADVAWIVDPALVSAAADGVAGEAGSAWAQELLATSTDREVLALPPHDPDVAALAHADVDPLLTDADASLDAAAGWRTDVTLPPEAIVDETTLSAAAAAGRGIVVIREGLDPVNTTSTPVDAATLSTAGGQVTALLPDPELSLLFAEPTSEEEVGSAFEGTQLLLARLAALGDQSSSVRSHVLLTTDRDWDPDPEATTRALAALRAAPFVELTPLSTLIGAEPDAVERASAPSSSIDDTELAPAQLRDLAARARQVQHLASATADPEAFAHDFLDQAAAVTSVAWRGSAERNEAIAAVQRSAGDLLSAISVVPGSNVNLISESGNLPIAVANDLPTAVTVGVRLVPDDHRLGVESVPDVTIAASSTSAVVVPVTAIGSGNVTVRVEILSPDGTLVSAPSSFTVRVRAEWESVGTAVLGGALGLLFIAGVVRTIRRGRRPTRLAPESVDDPRIR
ncbi:MAG: DUF6049 family protein [Cellulomonadaceae bacterium]